MSDIIQSLWIGQELSKIEQLCISSFIKNGSEFHLYTYDQVENIPSNTVIKDANEIINKNEIFKTRGGSYAIFADWFRFELLYKKGGFWVDMDMICLKPFDFEDEPYVFGRETQDSVSNAIMKFPKGDKISRFMADICKEPNTILPYDSRKERTKKIKRRYLKGNRRENVGWGEAGGPLGFSRCLQHHKIYNISKPFTYFFPIHPGNWYTIFDNTFFNNSSFFNGSYTVHLWNEMLRGSNLNKNSTFEENSLIEDLKSKYL
ncbi:glycosyltransferase [Endozoicomonas sp. Mp262]|uniref:glycosyltransferase n=1 Tax=Endozoicomonas sp. Mp262 TaxID=2919499 RepID=UPI0021D7F19A